MARCFVPFQKKLIKTSLTPGAKENQRFKGPGHCPAYNHVLFLGDSDIEKWDIKNKYPNAAKLVVYHQFVMAEHITEIRMKGD